MNKEEIKEIAKSIIMISFPDLDITINDGSTIDDDTRLILQINGMLAIISKLGFDSSKEFTEVINKIYSLLGNEDSPYTKQVEELIKSIDSDRDKIADGLAAMYRKVSN